MGSGSSKKKNATPPPAAVETQTEIQEIQVPPSTSPVPEIPEFTAETTTEQPLVDIPTNMDAAGPETEPAAKQPKQYNRFNWEPNEEDDQEFYEEEEERLYLPYNIDEALPHLQVSVSNLLTNPQLDSECVEHVQTLDEAFARWWDQQEDRETLTEVLLDCQYMEMIREVWLNIYRVELFKSSLAQSFDMGISLLEYCLRMCEAKTYACSRVLEVGFHQDILKFLCGEPLKPHRLGGARQRVRLTVILLKIIYHIVRSVPESRKEIRECHAVDILRKLFTAKSKEVQMLSLIIQSYLFTEKEADAKGITMEPLQSLIQTLDSHIKNNPQYLFEFSIDELVDSLNRLAAFDAFKDLLVRAGSLRCYSKLMKHDVEPHVKVKAVRGVWQLAFTCGLQVRREHAVMAGLRRLESSDDDDLGGAAEGALWVIEEREKEASVNWLSRPPDGRRYSERVGTVSVFMNHCSSDRLVQRISNSLAQCNFNVIINDAMPIDEMVRGIDEASIVVVCVSQSYKESPRCRTEARYIHRRNKLLVPIQLESDYGPDGWIDILLDNQPCIDFTKLYNFDQSLDRLIRHIRTKCPTGLNGYKDRYNNTRLPDIAHQQQQQHQLSRDVTSPRSLFYPEPPPLATLPHPGSPQRISLPPVQPRPPQNPRPSSIDNWSTREVDNWVERNNMEHLRSWFRGMNGEMLKNFAAMRRDAPEAFFSHLFRSELPMPDVMAMTAALERLNNKVGENNK